MSDTHRTDAAEEQSIRAYEKERAAGWPDFPCDGYDFARQLERELAAVTKERDSLREQCRVGDVAFQHLHCTSRGKPLPDWVVDGLPNMYTTLARIKRLDEAGDALVKLLNDDESNVSLMEWMKRANDVETAWTQAKEAR